MVKFKGKSVLIEQDELFEEQASARRMKQNLSFFR